MEHYGWHFALALLHQFYVASSATYLLLCKQIASTQHHDLIVVNRRSPEKKLLFPAI